MNTQDQHGTTATGFSNLKAVKERTGGKSTPSIYRWVNKHTFPAPVKIGPNSVAWRNSDLDEWEADPQQWRITNALRLLEESLRNKGAHFLADQLTNDPLSLTALAEETKQGGYHEDGAALEELAAEIMSGDTTDLA